MTGRKISIDELKAQYNSISKPYNESAKYWLGIDPRTAPEALLRDLTRNSYELVRAKYSKKKKSIDDAKKPK